MPCSGGPERHDQVDAGVECDRDQPEHDGLRGDVARGIDELRNEGEEERRRLRVERLDDDALAEGGPAAGRRHLGRPCDPRFPPCLDAQPDQVERARDLQHRERLSARHHQRRQPDGAGGHVHEPSEPKPDAGRQPLAPPAGQRPRHDIEDAGAGRQRDDECGGEEQEEGGEVGHKISSFGVTAILSRVESGTSAGRQPTVGCGRG